MVAGTLIEHVRSFNRTGTERVGALHDHCLGRDHCLSEAPLLWEIGTAGAELREPRARLEVDSAYVRRPWRSLKRQGLIVVEASQDDRRVRRARLTEAVVAERAELDQRADHFAQSMLAPLSESQQGRLATAMAEVERLLIA